MTAAVGSGLPTSGQQTLTKLPGMTDANSNQPYAFFMADLSAGVAGVDTLYVTDDTAGTITKFSKVVGGTTTWTVNGTVGAPVGLPADAYPVPAEMEEDEVMVAVIFRSGSSTTWPDLFEHCKKQLP